MRTLSLSRIAINNTRDIAAKIRDDPLLTIKQQEQSIYQVLVIPSACKNCKNVTESNQRRTRRIGSQERRRERASDLSARRRGKWIRDDRAPQRNIWTGDIHLLTVDIPTHDTLEVHVIVVLAR